MRWQWRLNRRHPRRAAPNAQFSILVIRRAQVVGAVTCDKSCQFFARSHVAMATTEIQQTVFFVQAAFCLLVLRAEGMITEH